MKIDFQRAVLLLSFPVAILAGCSNEVEQPYPSEWPPFVEQKRILFGDSCPSLAGKYIIARGHLSSLMIEKLTPTHGDRILWKYMEIQQVANNSIALRLTSIERYRPIVFTSLVQVEGKDYSCKNGWMIFPLTGRASDMTVKSSFMATGVDQEGNLIIKTTIQETREIDEIGVWCGDGCRAIPLPFTITEHNSFSRWNRWNKVPNIPDAMPLADFPRPVWYQ